MPSIAFQRLAAWIFKTLFFKTFFKIVTRVVQPQRL